jgi:zinc transport system ATP-binding protein
VDPESNREEVIRLREVSFSYGGPRVLEGVSLAVQAGEFLGLVGPNGGGKTTLLKIILGLLRPRSGEVRVLGMAPEKGRAHIGYVPQFAAFDRDFPISVRETVLLGRLGRTRVLGGYTRADKSIAAAVMREVHVWDIREQPLEALSGGQLQRVLVARALACEPGILLLDEPTANIDMRGEEDIFDLFRKLNERLTIMLVSHDIAFISRYVSRVACLNQTLVCHRTEAISGDIIEGLYGEPMRMIHHAHGPLKDASSGP